MLTLLISGSGTGVGKTRITAALARAAAALGRTVQIVKPVQTGVGIGDATDADIAAKLAGLPPDCAYTLARFRTALAPLSAADAAGWPVNANVLVEKISALPACGVRLVEGAGGLAVPLGPNGYDWVDFAQAIRARGVLLVVPDELGAINQSRLAHYYLIHKARRFLRGGIFLNSLAAASSEERNSTRGSLAGEGVPLWGELGLDSVEPALHLTLEELLRHE